MRFARGVPGPYRRCRSECRVHSRLTSELTGPPRGGHMPTAIRTDLTLAQPGTDPAALPHVRGSDTVAPTLHAGGRYVS
jgi:hypothetical protein